MNYAKLLVLLSTASWQLFVSDPWGFVIKVLERGRLSGVPAAEMMQRLIVKGAQETKPGAHAMMQQGNITEAAKMVSNSKQLPTLHELKSAKRNLEFVERISKPIQAGRSTRKRCQNKEIRTARPLFFLNNSLPHTQSGYTFRTHETMRALHAAGINASGLTRLGYPLLVGRVPSGDSEFVDGIEYRRALPYVYPRKLMARDRAMVDMIVDEAERLNANVLHTTTDFHNAQLVSQAGQKLSLPWVYEVRGELHKTWLSKVPDAQKRAAEKSEFFRIAARQEIAAMQAADAVVALSDLSKQHMVQAGVDERKIRVIPNAVDASLVGIEYDKSSIRAELCLPPGNLVGSVTSVVEYEGLDDLIRTLVLDTELRILIVGEGEARPKLEQLATELNVADRVTFAGRKPNDEIWKWYAALDVFVMPRKDRAVCRSVTPVKGLSAQALGVPLVVSDLPALREITGGFAEYVAPEDPKSLLDGIRNVIQTSYLARIDSSYKQRSVDWAASHTWASNAKRYERLYESLL